MTGRLDGKVAVVTGGASGIGAGTAWRFAAEGARCVIGDLQDERGEQLAAELGGDAFFVHADMPDEAQVADLTAGLRAGPWARTRATAKHGVVGLTQSVGH
jgi:NAD(P)-dependent dehydrogenase (short-subunit alcohol dehydrogenase family)